MDASAAYLLVNYGKGGKVRGAGSRYYRQLAGQWLRFLLAGQPSVTTSAATQTGHRSTDPHPAEASTNDLPAPLPCAGTDFAHPADDHLAEVIEATGHLLLYKRSNVKPPLLKETGNKI
jgi:hypothetical protein